MGSQIWRAVDENTEQCSRTICTRLDPFGNVIHIPHVDRESENQ